MELKELLRKHQNIFHSIFEPELNENNTAIMDFSGANTRLKSIDIENTSSLDKYISNLIVSGNYLYGYGGYLEDRDIYKRSPLFAEGEEHRTIHLGVDIWTPTGYPFYFPLNGKVHSFKNNNNYGDYGPTIIIEHLLEGMKFYTLYGHLSEDSIKNLSVGQEVKAGEKGGNIGKASENGNWPPHLHFQVIGDIMGYAGDFPGATTQKNLEKYKLICPDPGDFFGNSFVNDNIT